MSSRRRCCARTPVSTGRRSEREPRAGPERGTFVGRERELAELVGALEDALAGRGPAWSCSPASPASARAAWPTSWWHGPERVARACIVGRCWEAGGAPAYWPWVQSLRAYAREVEPEELRSQLGAGAAYLAQLLPELRDLFPDLPTHRRRPSPEGARFRLFEAVASFLRSAAEAGPLVIMLDDLHAADEPSLLLLRFLAREMADTGCSWCARSATSIRRSGEPLTADAGRTGPRAAHRADRARRGSTGPTWPSTSSVRPGSTRPAELVEAIHAETEGNPLFVAEVVHLLDAEDGSPSPDTHLHIPPGVREVISRRVARLSPRCRELLVPASVLGREFGLDPLGAAQRPPARRPAGRAGRGDGRARLTDVPGTRGRLRFGHALIRDTLYDELGPARRLQLHEQPPLRSRRSMPATSSPISPSWHTTCSRPARRGGAKAVEYARRAGDRAASQLAYEEAVRLYEMALTLVAGDDRHAASCSWRSVTRRRGPATRRRRSGRSWMPPTWRTTSA